MSTSNNDERNVIKNPKYPTNFKGNKEKEVKLFTAKLNSFL